MEECIQNVKISVFLDKNICTPSKSRKKIMKRVENLHLCVYSHSPHLINVTGIKKISDIEKSVQIVEHLYSSTCIKYTINCIMISCKTQKRTKLESIPELLSLGVAVNYYFDYNQELFCGAFLKPKIQRKFPTILIFHTGSFQIFGKDIEKIRSAFDLTQKIIAWCTPPCK